MRINTSKVVILVLLISGTLCAKPIRFRNDGLKHDTIVMLDVSEKSATGTYFETRAEDEEAKPAAPFTGKVIPTPKGKRGVYLEIQFAGTPPYNIPPGAKQLIWHLKIVDHRAHLFIPMQERNYEGRTPRWIVDDVELEPVTHD